MKKTSDITFILDRSGSMGSIKTATIEGFNSFLKDQKENKFETKVSLVQFDDEYEKVFTGIPIEEANYLTDQTFVPRGLTALIDAIGLTIKSTKKRFKNDPKSNKNTKAIIVILTDGHENSSKLYSLKDVQKKIRKQEEKHGWQFVFIGANQDAIHEASKFGISRNRALEFSANETGVQHAFSSLSHNLMASQSMDLKSFSFSEEDRDQQKQ